MSKSQWYYECHITMCGNREEIKAKVKGCIEGWKFSAIDGDPVLGAGVLCYATRHYNSRTKRDRVIEMMGMVSAVLREAGLTVIRQKVELVVFDTKRREVA